MTEQRVLEHQLRQAQKLEAVGRLAGGIAHDFNNILTAVRGHAELMLEDAGPVLREGLKEIGASADRAAELTRQLLAFSRQQVLQPRVLDLASVVQDVESLLRRVIGEHIRLELDVREGTGSIRADPTQIEQVLVNLAVNARDAMPGGGRLTFAVDAPEFQPDEPQGHPDPVPPGRYVRLTVSDTGEGMDAGTMGRMFDPFFTTKKTSQGTGLGLATVFGIVTQSGGLIRVHSQVGRGTEFQILFPPVAAAPHPPAEAPPPKRERPPAEGTILLVEDDDPVRRIARRVLERQGYHVLEAATPGSALRIAEETPGIDLLLTDIVMPGLDGAELAARIEERCPDIRILFMSGYTEDEMVRADIATGPAHFLPKPFGRLELETAVGNVLRRE